MVKARKYVAKKHFEGMPKRSDIELVEYELPPLENGEILIKAEWISVDPSQRVTNTLASVPYDIRSQQVGVVMDSKNPAFPVGSRVVSLKGWCDYAIANMEPKDDEFRLIPYKLPNLRGLSNSLAVGAVGMPGATAYLGFLDICKPKQGETVVVSGAAGAVGSIVGQIAKIKGCKVIGFAGTDEKCEWLEKELGFDKAYNYKKTNVDTALKESAPNGVDCYFDNVGGDISSAVIKNMNIQGRIAVCGVISNYNEKKPLSGDLLMEIMFRTLTVQGVSVYYWQDKWPRAFADMTDWISSGKLKAREHVTEGFDKVFDAFVGMLAGENVGKAVVKV